MMEYPSLRIALVGNQDNNAFRICRWLRHFGQDAHLFLHPDNLSQPRSHPNLVDRSLDMDTCPWIHIYQNLEAWYPYFRKTDASRAIEAKFDAVCTSGSSIMFGLQFDAIPVFHLALGGDVRDIPRKGWLGPGPMEDKITSFIYRKALRNCARVFAGLSTGVTQTMEQLGMRGKVVYFAYPEDVEYNRRCVNRELLTILNRTYTPYRTVFLWLSRVNFKSPDPRYYKGTDIFLRAFARLVRENGPVRAVVGRHGNDVQAFHNLAEQLDVLEHIDFVDHLPFWKLLTYLSIDKAVAFDSLSPYSRSIGGLSREALSLGTPLARRTDPFANSFTFGPGMPVNIVYDENDCLEAMRGFARWETGDFSGHREKVRQWANDHLHYENAPSMRRLLCEIGGAVAASRDNGQPRRPPRRDTSLSTRLQRLVLASRRMAQRTLARRP